MLDKWFALQAQIPERETLDARSRGLMRHHGFSLANPNRVRSLIGGFTANQETSTEPTARALRCLRKWWRLSIRPIRRSRRGS